MRKLLAPILVFTVVGSAHAELPAILFGAHNLAAPLAANQTNHVLGPLLQLQTPAGTTVSLQRGAAFKLDDSGNLILQSGNLRLGPAGGDILTLILPTGPVSVAPLTALTLTVKNAETTGRIYAGTLSTPTRTFKQGEGFALTPTGAHGTFTPAPAQAPEYENLAAIAPAAGAQSTTPPTPASNPLTTNPPRTSRPNTSTAAQPETPSVPQTEPQPQPQQPEPQQPEQPTQPQPEPEQPSTPQPQPENPTQVEPQQPAIEQPQPEQPQPEQPEPEQPQPEQPQPENPQPEQPEPQQPEPETPAAEVPSPLLRTGLYAAWSEPLANTAMPNAVESNPLAFTMGVYQNGTQQLNQTQSTYLGLKLTTLNQGTALQQDVFSHDTGKPTGPISGLGRWVGGELMSVSGPAYNPTVTPFSNPASIHYIWGEKPTAIPTTGTLTYSLLASTQPTYTGTTSEGPGTFTGNLSMNFAPDRSGIIGTYNLTGTVTMPQTTMVGEGADAHPVTTPTSYQIATPSQGVPLTATFSNPGILTVTAPSGALACPSDCTGTINAAGFGAGMKDVGTLYAINPNGQTGITGAAIFTAAP